MLHSSQFYLSVFTKQVPNTQEKMLYRKVSNLSDEELALKEKLEYIKGLLLNKKEKEANNLLKKIKVNNKKEREILDQFERNKILYLNKAK